MTEKKRILITGAAGFLGSHLCDRFIRDDFHVIAMDNLITGRLKNIEHLFHLENFEFYNHDVSKFIHVPGKLDYGDPNVHPQNEDYWGNVNPVGPRGVYDEAKRFQEAITMAYHNFHGLETRIVRIFNTYGPRMRLNDGRVLPAFIGQALRGEDLTVFGDGSQTRSFCYVDDLIEGIVRLLHSDYVYPVNIGNPDEISISAFAEEIIKLTGTDQKVIYKDLPVDDPKQRRPDISRAKELLDWSPKVHRSKGLKITYEYFKSLSSDELMQTDHYNFDKYIIR